MRLTTTEARCETHRLSQPMRTLWHASDMANKLQQMQMETVASYQSSMKALAALQACYQVEGQTSLASDAKDQRPSIYGLNGANRHASNTSGDILTATMLERREVVLPSRATSKTLQSTGTALATQLAAALHSSHGSQGSGQGDDMHSLVRSQRIQLLSIGTAAIRGQSMVLQAGLGSRGAREHHASSGAGAGGGASAAANATAQAGVPAEAPRAGTAAVKRRKTTPASSVPTAPSLCPLPVPLPPLPMSTGAAHAYAAYVRTLAMHAVAALQPERAGGSSSSGGSPSVLSPVFMRQRAQAAAVRTALPAGEGGTGRLAQASALLDCMARMIADACATLAPSARVSRGALALLHPPVGSDDSELPEAGSSSSSSGAGADRRIADYVQGVLVTRAPALQALDLICFLSTCVAPAIGAGVGLGSPVTLALRAVAREVQRLGATLQGEGKDCEAALAALEQLLSSAHQLRATLTTANAAHGALLLV